MTSKQQQGKRNKINGARWELKVREDLESKDYIVIKNPNNIIDNKYIQGKSKWNPITKRPMMVSQGFPDFWIYKPIIKEVIGVECKSNGILDREEKSKCDWLLNNQIFNKILIASKQKNGRKVEVLYKEK